MLVQITLYDLPTRPFRYKPILHKHFRDRNRAPLIGLKCKIPNCIFRKIVRHSCLGCRGCSGYRRIFRYMGHWFCSQNDILIIINILYDKKHDYKYHQSSKCQRFVIYNNIQQDCNKKKEAKYIGRRHIL